MKLRIRICVHPSQKYRKKLGRLLAKILIHTLFPSINEFDLPQPLAKPLQCMHANAPHDYGLSSDNLALG